MGNRPIAFIVDDENLVASTFELLLMSKGFNARSFVDPLDALDAAQTTKPHLLLTDVMMPNMNGVELAVQIRQLHPQCCVLLLSGQPSAHQMVSTAALEGQHFEILAKPVHPKIMLDKIQELLEAHTGPGR